MEKEEENNFSEFKRKQAIRRKRDFPKPILRKGNVKDYQRLTKDFSGYVSFFDLKFLRIIFEILGMSNSGEKENSV